MEDLVPRPHPTKQEELVSRFCLEAEALLADAPDYAAAVRMKDTLCLQFERECDSPLVVSAAKQFMEEYIQQQWERREP